MNSFRKYINTKKNLLLTVALLTAFSSKAFANWEPEFCLEKDVSALENKRYTKLKTNVLSYLENSWCSQEKANLLMDLILLEKPEVCVEIGTFTGSSILPIAASLKFLKHGQVFAVDAWSNEEAVKNWPDNDPNKSWWATLDMNSVYSLFESMVKEWKISSVCTPIRLSSEEASSQFDSIDFLHLDGDYSEVGSVKDVELYLPKVKSGGYILLSNLFTMVNGKQPKLKAFCLLIESCEIVCEIENDNAILFRKY